MNGTQTSAGTVGFPTLVQDFFLRRLVQQRGASARTIESYRDALRPLITFAEQRTGKPPSAMHLGDLDAPLVLDFLDHLESDRGNTVRPGRYAGDQHCPDRVLRCWRPGRARHGRQPGAAGREPHRAE